MYIFLPRLFLSLAFGIHCTNKDVAEMSLLPYMRFMHPSDSILCKHTQIHTECNFIFQRHIHVDMNRLWHMYFENESPMTLNVCYETRQRMLYHSLHFFTTLCVSVIIKYINVYSPWWSFSFFPRFVALWYAMHLILSLH